MNLVAALTAALVTFVLPASQQAQQSTAPGADAPARTSEKHWIEVSNGYTRQLLAIGLKHGPEGGSQQGLAQFDTLISKPTLADQHAGRVETEAELARIRSAMVAEKDKDVLEDMAIVQKAYNLSFRTEDYNEAHEVPFFNATATIFGGLQTLLDPQTPDMRRAAAVVRLRKYVGGTVDGEVYTPFADILKQLTMEQMAKPDMVYPSRGEMETELSRNGAYLDGLSTLFTKYKLTGWQEPLDRLKVELTSYDAWIRANLL